MPVKAYSYVRISVIERAVGIKYKTLTDRGLRVHFIDGCKQYDFEELIEKCPDLFVKFLSRRLESGEENPEADLRDQERAEKIRKLKIDNDVKEGLLVDVDEMRLTYGRKVREVGDILDSIPTRVKMGAPDVSQSVLEVVQRSVSDIRNKVADHQIGVAE